MAETTTPTEQKSKDTLQREAYSAATKRVRESHRDEFNTFMVEEMKARGLDWAPKPTAEEKAEAELQRILAEHPGLAAKVTGTPTTAEPTAP